MPVGALITSARFSPTFSDSSVGDPTGPLVPVVVGNEVTLDFMDAEPVAAQHYAFRVDDGEFDPIFERIRARGARFYADPDRQNPDQINHRFGGRGVYFDDPDGHLMEVLTYPG